MLRYPAEAVHAASRARQAQPEACRLVTERKILKKNGDTRSMKRVSMKPFQSEGVPCFQFISCRAPTRGSIHSDTTEGTVDAV